MDASIAQAGVFGGCGSAPVVWLELLLERYRDVVSLRVNVGCIGRRRRCVNIHRYLVAMVSSNSSASHQQEIDVDFGSSISSGQSTIYGVAAQNQKRRERESY